MKRILSTLLATAGLASIPFAANAAGTYVTSDGTVFDSDVGAACGALHTDVLFQPGERAIDMQDESVLDYLANCFSSGELSGARIAIIGFGDEDLSYAGGADLARDRVASVVSYLMQHGVDARNVTTWAYASGWPGEARYSPDRVQFRILSAPAMAAPAVWYETF